MKKSILVAALTALLAAAPAIPASAADAMVPATQTSRKSAKKKPAAGPKLVYDETVAPLADGAKSADLIFFELSGPVKSCEMTDYRQAKSTVGFDRKGSWDQTYNDKKVNVVRDSNGHMTRLTGGSAIDGKYYWEDDEKYSWAEDNANINDRDSNDFSYNADGSMKTRAKDTKDGRYYFRFSDYVFDSHGNWTSRKVAVSKSNATPETYTETRVITYYE